MNKPMYCPCCGDLLVQGTLERYECTGEHICDPNGERAARPTLVCKNKTCETYSGLYFWSEDGDGPYCKAWAAATPPWHNDNPHPFNSYHRASYFSSFYDKEDHTYSLTKSIKLKKRVRYESNDFGNKVGKHTTYSWIVKGVYWTPGYKMLLFGIKQLIRQSKDIKSLKSEVNDVLCRAKWPRAEWWRKAVAVWVRVFYRKFIDKPLEKKYK
jgi:hypothetical protein